MYLVSGRTIRPALLCFDMNVETRRAQTSIAARNNAPAWFQSSVLFCQFGPRRWRSAEKTGGTPFRVPCTAYPGMGAGQRSAFSEDALLLDTESCSILQALVHSQADMQNTVS
jgi:hypothetical protein